MCYGRIMKKSIDQGEKVSVRLASILSDFYDRALMDSVRTVNPLLTHIKYKKVRVPKYFTIKLPVIGKVIDYDWGDVGYRIYLKDFELFQIGWKYVEKPVWKKTGKGTAIKFRTYGKIKPEPKIK